MEQNRPRFAEKPRSLSSAMSGRCWKIQPCSRSNQVLGSSRLTQKREITLPSEIICEILIKLTVDHLRNCMSVCKSWNSLIKSEHFILRHLKLRSLIKSKNTQDMNMKDDLLLVHVVYRVNNILEASGGDVLTLDCDNDNNEYTKSSDFIPMSGIRNAVSSIYGAREFRMDMIDSHGYCNGLICAVYRQDLMPLLWNPCIRKILVLPRPTLDPEWNNYYLLGYDSSNKDFKVMHVSQQLRGSSRFEIFSLRGGSWKDLNAPQNVEFRYVTATDICGAFHWLCIEPRPNSNKVYTAVVSFNLSTETFKQMVIPNKVKKRKPWSCGVVSYRESLALLSGRKRDWIVDLWVMNEYDVGESWTRVMKILHTDFTACYPVYFRKNGEIMKGTFGGGVEIFDRERKTVKRLLYDSDSVSLLYPFFASLVLVDRADAFSY